MARKKPDWEALRSALAIRAGFRCEGCGLPFEPHPMHGFSASHRLPRSAGIKAEWVHGLANLTLFCGQGSENDGSCHGKIQHNFDESIANGHSISRFDKRLPSQVPILLYGGWYLLGDDGSKVRIGA